MAMYAIKDTTLTAFGDAIRYKTNGISELPVSVYPKTTLSFMGTYPFEFPAYVKKIKITGKLEHDYTTYHTKLKGLGVAPIKSGAKDTVLNNEGFVIVVDEVSGYEYGTNYDTDFEIIIDSNVFTFVAPTNENATPVAYLSYTAIGLDENGNEFKYTPLEMVDKINELDIVPEVAFNITGNCNYRFANNSWNWLINQFGDKITTKDIDNVSYMFFDTTLNEIPFVINLKDSVSSAQSMFSNCRELIYAPMVNINNPTNHMTFVSMFGNCYFLKEVPEWLGDWLEKDRNIPKNNNVFGPWQGMFSSCHSLRTIPEKVMKNMRNDSMTGIYYGIAYSKPFPSLICLDELLGIHCDNYSYTSNQFSNFISNLYRVKNITFATNEDGTPVVRPWKSQTFDFSSNIGFTASGYRNSIINSASGITADKEVKDDATYQALKNDPDWFSCNVNYSRYNHDSAVNTINSLPDCSATGTNTIKFKGTAGSLTDGGAINTLTEEEIAVATAKGWTVSLV